jgi:hypothetical protein
MEILGVSGSLLRGNQHRVFDSTAILIYLAEKTGQLLGTSEDRPELLSWLLFIASGLGPFSGQAVHFQFAAPEGLDYAANRYRREAERHYQGFSTITCPDASSSSAAVSRSPTSPPGAGSIALPACARAPRILWGPFPN